MIRDTSLRAFGQRLSDQGHDLSPHRQARPHAIILEMNVESFRRRTTMRAATIDQRHRKGGINPNNDAATIAQAKSPLVLTDIQRGTFNPSFARSSSAMSAPVTGKCRRYSRRRIKTQTVLPCAETVPMLLWALLASGQIQMRKVDGWETLSQPIEPITLDLAA